MGLPGADALGLLSAPFGGGFPSISGGDAGPSSAGISNSTDVVFSNAFAVGGGDANATPSLNNKSGASPLLIGGVAILIFFLVRKK